MRNFLVESKAKKPWEKSPKEILCEMHEKKIQKANQQYYNFQIFMFYVTSATRGHDMNLPHEISAKQFFGILPTKQLNFNSSIHLYIYF